MPPRKNVRVSKARHPEPKDSSVANQKDHVEMSEEDDAYSAATSSGDEANGLPPDPSTNIKVRGFYTLFSNF